MIYLGGGSDIHPLSSFPYSPSVSLLHNHHLPFYHNSIQVSDEGSLITDFSLIKPGQTCVGVVVHQFPRVSTSKFPVVYSNILSLKGGSLVSFYNDIRGMLSDFECRKKKNLS